MLSVFTIQEIDHQCVSDALCKWMYDNPCIFYHKPTSNVSDLWPQGLPAWSQALSSYSWAHTHTHTHWENDTVRQSSPFAATELGSSWSDPFSRSEHIWWGRARQPHHRQAYFSSRCSVSEIFHQLVFVSRSGKYQHIKGLSWRACQVTSNLLGSHFLIFWAIV